MSLSLPEPPTKTARSEARSRIQFSRKSIDELDRRIQSVEDELAQIISRRQYEIDELKQERATLQRDIDSALAYVSPIRSLPNELLRHMFMLNFEDDPCCAWQLAAVCTSWRILCLTIPKLWSKIRLNTTPNSSADTIRLWLERSGSTLPLDIEITRRVQTSTGKTIRRRSASPIRHVLLPPLSAQYIAVPPPNIMQLPAHNPFALPPSPPVYPVEGPPHSPTPGPWGHIAFYYLAKQIRRWERFIFRFDKRFDSMDALKSITGDAPLLKEFEVSCAEPAFYSTDWSWLPSAKADISVSLPRLHSLTLQSMPFKWSSPIFKDLQSLTLRSLPTSHLPLNRVMSIVAANPRLRSLDLHLGTVQPAVLPLTPLTLKDLSVLSLGGHYLLSQLVEILTLPSITSLSYDIEARDPVEETITNLISRSNNPALTTLSIAYGINTSFYYGAAGGVISWNFLLELSELRCLKVGGAPFEPLLNILTKPDEDQHQWYCPKLSEIYMRGCHAHGEGAAKLVQMVGARNPVGGSSSAQAPVDRLKHLELHECAVLGRDVIQWLEGLVSEVVCTDPQHERSSRSPPYGYM